MSDERRCPDCGAKLAENRGFITWCPECNWNLSPNPERPADTKLAAFERRLMDGSSRRLSASIAKVSAEKTKPPLWRGLAACLLALPIHLVTLGTLAGGVLLVVFGGTTWHRILGGVLLIVAIGISPRPEGRPRHSQLFTADQAPALFSVTQSVAEVIHAPMPAEILISRDVNAAVTRVGYRNRRILLIGAPLWVASPPQARIALLGHELGHFAHGDLLRGFWIGTAFQTGIRWLKVTVSGLNLDAYSRFIDRLIFGPFRRIMISYLELIMLVNAPAKRQQEVLADLDGLRVGGSEGAIALMDALLSAPSISIAMSRSAISSQQVDMWAVVRTQVEAVPEIERERRRRAAAYDRNRIDDSHPTTSIRMDLLKSRPAAEPAVRPDASVWARVDAELAPAMRNAARHARDALRR